MKALLAAALCLGLTGTPQPPAPPLTGYVVMYDRNTLHYAPKPDAVYMSWVEAWQHIVREAPQHPFGFWYIEQTPVYRQ